MKTKTVLAVGADIKNMCLLAQGSRLYPGPRIGDLSVVANYERFEKGIRRLLKKAQARPDIIACDLHPGYFSTRLAAALPYRAGRCLLKSVQHHHAHIASVIHEHGLKNPVIGVSFDGTGFGTDGRVWGSEFLAVDRHGFSRLAHLDYIKMPGGDLVVRQPWRMVLSLLGRQALPFLKKIKRQEAEIVLSMIEKNINAPQTCGAGRIFDAAAALLGVCTRASFEAQGPMMLEAMCIKGIEAHYDFAAQRKNGCYVLDARPVFLSMMADLKRRMQVPVIATKFHNAIVRMIATTVGVLSKELGIKHIAMSGGVFQNRFLLEKTTRQLKASSFCVFTNDALPVNDFNIAWGQYHVSGCCGKS